jgi:ubiquinone/menaquinone biosynthesis C-methylase UbiE
MKSQKRFIPAMHFRWLTPFYDTLVNWTLPDTKLKVQLIEQARIQPHHKILDLGCGTATLALLVKQRYAEATVIGLDIDPEILKIARRKVSDSGAEIALHEASATQLPYADDSFDRVLSSFAMHHLTYTDKQRAVAEVFRVLRPGCEFHVLDFGKPHNFYTLLVSYALRWTEELMENIQGLLPRIFEDAGFIDVAEKSRNTTLVGEVSLYQSLKP